MKVDIKDLSSTKKQMVVEIPIERVKSEMEKVMSEIRGSAHIPGFRPGKVPDQVLKMRIGKDLRKQVGANLIEQSLPETSKEFDFEVIGEPEFDSWDLVEDAPFSFSFRFDIIPNIEIKEYKNLEINIPKMPLEESEIQSALERIQKSHATYEVISDRTAEENDRIFGKLTLSINDEIVPGWKQRSVDFVIGGGKLFPGSELESKIIGAQSGQDHLFSIDFPADYKYYADFSGKTIQVKLAISEVKAMKTPAIDDELAKDAGFATLDLLLENIKVTLSADKEKSLQDKAEDQLIELIMSKNDFEIPAPLVAQEREMIKSRLQLAESTPESADDFFTKMAETIAKRNVALDKIAKQEKLDATEDDIEEEFEKSVSYQNADREQLRKEWEERGYFDHIKRLIKRDKARKFVVETNKITFTEPEPLIAGGNTVEDK